MIAWLWSQQAGVLVVVWAVLAAVWLAALPRDKTRWIDRVYPVAPLAVAALHAWQLAPFTSAWLQLALWLWVSLTGVWIVSLIKKDASIMDIAYGLLLLA